MAETYSGLTLFGCSVRSITSQIGINQTPTVVTVIVVQDSNQSFDIGRGVGSFKSVVVGSFTFRGIVQSYSQAEVDVGGRDIFTVKLTDPKVAFAAAQVVFAVRPDGVNFGTNVIVVEPNLEQQLKRGIPLSQVISAVDGKSISYGTETFTLNLNDLGISRVSESTYTIKGSSMSVLELVQKITEDHGIDWYVSTSTSRVISFQKIEENASASASLNTNVIRRASGQELRPTITKAVVLGAQRQFLSNSGGVRWRQFWGFTDAGSPASSPTFSIVSHQGQSRTRSPSVDLMRRALNGELKDEEIGLAYIDALKAYGQEYWGRKFYLNINSSFLDANNEPWIDIVSAAPWEGTGGRRRPANFSLNPEGAIEKFGTNDGRWVSLIELPNPAYHILNRRGARWDASVLGSPNVFASGYNKYFMRVSLELVGRRIIMTLPTPMIVTAVVDLETIEPDSGVECTGSRILSNNGTGSYTTGGNDRMSRIQDSWLAIRDKRRFYGPFQFSVRGKKGKTTTTIDQSFAPWTFSVKDTSFSSATSSMESAAIAKAKSISSTDPVVDTLETDLTGLPVADIGDSIGGGGILTSIGIRFGIDGVVTSYRGIQHTDELHKHRRYFQDTIDRLTNEVQKVRDSYFETPSFPGAIRELSSIRKSSATSNVDNNNTDINTEFTQGVPISVEDREADNGSLYKVLKMKEVSDGTDPTTGAPITRFVGAGGGLIRNVKNTEEFSGRPARVLSGTIATMKKNCTTGRYFFSASQTIPSSESVTITGPAGPLSIVDSQEVELRSGHPLYSVSSNVSVNPTLTTNERINLISVPNLSENYVGVLRAQTRQKVELTWNLMDSGTVSPSFSFTPLLPKSMKGTILSVVSAGTPSSPPTYSVQVLFDSNLNLLASELAALGSVPNEGEPVNSPGRLEPGAEVTVQWRDLENGLFSPELNKAVHVFQAPV